jgi:hypothetical protein
MSYGGLYDEYDSDDDDIVQEPSIAMDADEHDQEQLKSQLLHTTNEKNRSLIRAAIQVVLSERKRVMNYIHMNQNMSKTDEAGTDRFGVPTTRKVIPEELIVKQRRLWNDVSRDYSFCKDHNVYEPSLTRKFDDSKTPFVKVAACGVCAGPSSNSVESIVLSPIWDDSVGLTEQEITNKLAALLKTYRELTDDEIAHKADVTRYIEIALLRLYPLKYAQGEEIRQAMRLGTHKEIDNLSNLNTFRDIIDFYLIHYQQNPVKLCPVHPEIASRPALCPAFPIHPTARYNKQCYHCEIDARTPIKLQETESKLYEQISQERRNTIKAKRHKDMMTY